MAIIIIIIIIICGPPAAISCSYRDTGVPCSVVGPFLWPARRPATRYPTTCEIRHARSFDGFRRDLKTFLVLLAYTAHQRLCDFFCFDTDTDIRVARGYVAAAAPCE